MKGNIVRESTFVKPPSVRFLLEHLLRPAAAAGVQTVLRLSLRLSAIAWKGTRNKPMKLTVAYGARSLSASC